MSDLYRWVQAHDTPHGDLWAALESRQYTPRDSFLVLTHDDPEGLRHHLANSRNVSDIMIARLFAAAFEATGMQNMTKNIHYIADRQSSICFVFSFLSVFLLNWIMLIIILGYLNLFVLFVKCENECELCE